MRRFSRYRFVTFKFTDSIIALAVIVTMVAAYINKKLNVNEVIINAYELLKNQAIIQNIDVRMERKKGLAARPESWHNV